MTPRSGPLGGALLLALAAVPAAAQQPAPAPPRPARPNALPVPVERQAGALLLSAAFAGSGVPIRAGLTWRLYRELPDGSVDLAASATGAAPSFTVPPGPYVIHVAYGLAGTARRIELAPEGGVERLTLAAGALRVLAQVGDAPVAPGKASLSVFTPLPGNSEGRLVAEKVRPGDLVRLPEGAYHVVSTYGDSNATVRADLRVEAGQVTEATLRHRAATVVMKLVMARGGEALADTAWSVLTPGGDIVREAIGAFPSMTLAEGAYTVIARNAGKVHTAEVTIRSGFDGDVEVVAK